MFLELARPARDAPLPLIGVSSKSINHVSYEGLRTRPIAVSIVTKTESRTVEEAEVQLGVWLVAQVARIEALFQQVVLRKVNNIGQRKKSGPTIDVFSRDPTHLISQIVFPLLDVQSESWPLFFGRVSILPNMSDTRIPPRTFRSSIQLLWATRRI